MSSSGCVRLSGSQRSTNRGSCSRCSANGATAQSRCLVFSLGPEVRFSIYCNLDAPEDRRYGSAPCARQKSRLILIQNQSQSKLKARSIKKGACSVERRANGLTSGQSPERWTPEPEFEHKTHQSGIRGKQQSRCLAAPI